MSKKSAPPRVFSYSRFSTASQADGGSLKRQTALTEAYCKRRGFVLDDTLSLQDLGVSAFRSDNVKQGALAGFLEACRGGRVPKGSHLVVESLDRLSRDQIRPALQLFLALQDYGITIVTLQPEREYPPDGTDALALIEPLIIFARAHEESAMKSHRRRDGWKQARDKARAGGGPMLKTCPAWLEVTPNGFRVKKDAAAVVRRIYEMARDGLGVHRITARLQVDKVPPIGNGARWVKAYVYRILTNPAAMGTYQPHREGRQEDGERKKMVPDGPPVPGHYPAVVSAEDWEAAQAAIHGRGGGRGAGRRGAAETNLFSGLLREATTGEKMHIVNGLGRKGDGERKRYVYLCPTRETGVPAGARIDYGVFETAILSMLKELRPADVAPADGPARGRQSEMERLSGRLVDIDSRLERTKQRARTAGDFDAFLDLLQKLQEDRKHVADRLAELDQEQDGRAASDLGEAQTLVGLLENAKAGQLEELRRRLKERIRQLVADMRVVLVPRGPYRYCAAQLWFRSGVRRDYVIVVRPARVNREGQWWVESTASLATRRDLDLRKPGDARKLENFLSKVKAIE